MGLSLHLILEPGRNDENRSVNLCQEEEEKAHSSPRTHYKWILCRKPIRHLLELLPVAVGGEPVAIHPVCRRRLDAREAVAVGHRVQRLLRWRQAVGERLAGPQHRRNVVRLKRIGLLGGHIERVGRLRWWRLSIMVLFILHFAQLLVEVLERCVPVDRRR